MKYVRTIEIELGNDLEKVIKKLGLEEDGVTTWEGVLEALSDYSVDNLIFNTPYDFEIGDELRMVY